jgi:hypothetical protein
VGAGGSLPRIIEQRDGDSDTTDEFIWGPGYVDELVTHDRDTDGDGTTDQRLYAVHDRQYNVLMLADEDGAAVEQYSYSPYGADPLDPRDGFAHTVEGDSQLPLTPDMSAGQFLYTGCRYDKAVGLNHHRVRRLSHNLGRWTRIDPIGVTPTASLVNGRTLRLVSSVVPTLQYYSGPGLYCYASGNPSFHSDPSGLILPELTAELFYRYAQKEYLRKLKSLSMCQVGKNQVEKNDAPRVEVHKYSFEHEKTKHEGFLYVEIDLIWARRKCWVSAHHYEAEKGENEDGTERYWYETKYDLYIGECQYPEYCKSDCMKARERLRGGER